MSSSNNMDTVGSLSRWRNYYLARWAMAKTAVEIAMVRTGTKSSICPVCFPLYHSPRKTGCTKDKWQQRLDTTGIVIATVVGEEGKVPVGTAVVNGGRQKWRILWKLLLLNRKRGRLSVIINMSVLIWLEVSVRIRIVVLIVERYRLGEWVVVWWGVT